MSDKRMSYNYYRVTYTYLDDDGERITTNMVVIATIVTRAIELVKKTYTEDEEWDLECVEKL